MTTVGYGDITPVLPVEYIIAMIVMLSGASMYAFIIGRIASLFSNIDSAKVGHWNRIEAITQFLRYRQVPQKLNTRVRNYYEYIWAHHRGIKPGEFFNDLPGPLKFEILLHLTKELRETVPLFKYATPTLRDILVKALDPQTFAPEDLIVQEGDIGEEIYFISQGKAEILSDAGRKNHGVLEKGDYFGYMSFILREKRTASVKAISYCEIFVLTSDAFNRIMTSHPELRSVLKKLSSEKTDKIAALVLEGIIL
jgi:voltage-gated potassium channel